jgi:regulator of sigma E protease
LEIRNVVREVTPGSSAQTAGVRPGDVLQAARFLPQEGDKSELAAQLAEITLDLAKSSGNWMIVYDQMQNLPQGMQIQLTLLGSDKKERKVVLTPEPLDGYYTADRGFFFATLQRQRTAESLGEAVALGTAETVDSLSMVFRFIRKLFEQQISPRMLGGPITIAQAAGYSAFAGFSTLLLFLTMLSANLAVINFLPIPLLDGGHMVFLTLEGILRRPVSEKVVIAFHTLGFAFIISLMLFVLGLDLGIIPRNM